MLGALWSLGAASVARADTLSAPELRSVAPAGMRLTAEQAIERADRTRAARTLRAEHSDTEAVPFVHEPITRRRWTIAYTGAGDYTEVVIDDRSGAVAAVWSGAQAEGEVGRPDVAGVLFRPYVWLPLCLLFLLPFVDPRRPFRLLHLDLLALLGFGISNLFLFGGHDTLFYLSLYPLLGYLLVRMVVEGARRRERSGRLMPLVPAGWLAVGLVLLVAFRIGLNLTDSHMLDAGYAGVVGADRIIAGEQLYVSGGSNFDTYGPVNYLAYVPFETIFPWGGLTVDNVSVGSDNDPAAGHAAAISFDLLTMLGLFLIGWRLLGGASGRRLGLALAFAWASFPYTLFALVMNTNDTLIAMLLVYALLALTSPPGRGLLLGLASAVKFVPLLLAPLFARGAGPLKARDPLVFGLTFAVTVAVSVALYLPDGGLREFYDATLGFQLSRKSLFSVWGAVPALDWLHTLVKIAVAVFAVAVAVVPRQRDLVQVAALGAAVIVGVELTATYWTYFYIVWFLPFVLVALFARYLPELSGAREPRSPSPLTSELALAASAPPAGH